MQEQISVIKPKSKKKKWIVIIAIIVVIAILAALIVPRMLATRSSTAPTIMNTSVTKGTLATTVEANGSLEENTINVEIPYSVTVSDILVDEDDYVNDGDKLATLSSSSLEDEVDDVQDLIDDLDDKIEDQEDNEANVAALKERKTELVAIKKALNKIGKKDAIYASGNGIVSDINISEDSYISSSSSDSSTSDSSETTQIENLRNDYFGTAITIDSNDTMAIEVEIDELDIATIKTGQEAEITVDAIEDKTYTGEVTKINDSVDLSSGVAKYSANIEVDKASTMKTGMSASATITKESAENVLTIPVAAIQEDASGQYVYTSTDSDDNLGGKTSITTGLSDGAKVEITKGLNEGDTVYYSVVASDSSSEDQMMMFGGQAGQMPSGGEMPSGGGMPSGGSAPSGSGSGGGTPPSSSGSN